MKVIVLTRGAYSDYRIYGVFTSEEAARQYAARTAEAVGDEFEYEEYELDAKLAERWQPVFFCKLDLDGNLVEQGTDGRELLPPNWTETNLGQSDAFYARSTVSAEHALKVCAESRQQWFREHPEFCFWWIARAENNGKPTVTKFRSEGTAAERKLLETNYGDLPKSGVLSSGLSHRAFSLISAEDAIAKVEELQRERAVTAG